MRKGFTILELLVASLLLGLLVTILTMIFNQSSIAWRTGDAMVTDLDEVRNDVANVREVADNAITDNNGQLHLIIGLWDDDNNLRKRACDKDASYSIPSKLNTVMSSFGISSGSKPEDYASASKTVNGTEAKGSLRNYTVNVMSAGPDRQFDTWDDIWSFPDDPEEW